MIAVSARNLVLAKTSLNRSLHVVVSSFYNGRSQHTRSRLFSNSTDRMSFTDRQSLKFVTNPTDLGIVSASSAVGQLKPGVESAPHALMSTTLPKLLEQSLGLTLHGHVKADDCAALHQPDDLGKGVTERAREVASITRAISRLVHGHAKSGRTILTLGGDHSIAIGSVSGVAKAVSERSGKNKSLGVIWVDAHADINTPQTSGSGNVHGQPLGFLSGLARPSSNVDFGWIQDEHRIDLGKLVYIGIRDIDDSERNVIKENNVKAFTPFDVTHLGIKAVMDDVLDYLGPDTPIHLGFDIDGLDPSVAPSTGLPVPGGLTLREGQYICERLSRSGQLVAMDMVEVNPQIGSKLDVEKTLEAAVSVIYAGLGGSIL